MFAYDSCFSPRRPVSPVSPSALLADWTSDFFGSWRLVTYVRTRSMQESHSLLWDACGR